MAITNAQLAQQISELVAYWRTRDTQFQGWLAGAATGGPYGDGRFPLTDYLNTVYYAKSPLALQSMVDGQVSSASAYATAAAGSSTSATSAKVAAEAARDLALSYRNSAQSARDLAYTYQQNAASSASNADTRATAAASSATAAATSATSADASKTAAATSATNAASSASAAAASAASAATFDPSSYYTKTVSDSRYRLASVALTTTDISNLSAYTGFDAKYRLQATSLTTTDISNLSSYTGFDSRYRLQATALTTTDISNLSAYTGFDSRYRLAASSITNADITSLAYSKLTAVPTTFAPSAHTHVVADITDINSFTASNSFRVNVADTRSTATTPQTINQGVVFDFKGNSTESLNDGGSYFGEMTFRQYGSSSDWTGGLSHQLGFTDNNNLWIRSGSGTTWGTWKKFLDTGNYSGTLDTRYRQSSTAIVDADITSLAYSKLTGVPSTFSPSAHTHVLADITDRAKLLNNYGTGHATQTSFDAITDFGFRYVQGTTSGPGISGATQYYGMTLGLGSEYLYTEYASQLYWPRVPTGGNPYLSVRFRESGTWQAWQKIYAGYADSAGTATLVSGPFSSGLSSNGDLYAVRSGGTTGVVYLGSSGSKYLYYDGSNYNMPGGGLNVGGAGSFTANLYSNIVYGYTDGTKYLATNDGTFTYGSHRLNGGAGGYVGLTLQDGARSPTFMSNNGAGIVGVYLQGLGYWSWYDDGTKFVVAKVLTEGSMGWAFPRFTSGGSASGGRITVSTSAPSGTPLDGDIWLQRAA